MGGEGDVFQAPGISKLYNLSLKKNSKVDLEEMRGYQKLFGYPDRAFKSIHIAGTNGKGSVAWKIALSLQKAGYKVGLYTSPHISSFTERILVDGIPISLKKIEELLQEIFLTISNPSTFFEIMTLAALLYFEREKVDYAVIEVGLGGRLDATNVISPILSVVTSIGFDHCHILGNTLELIANEKAGIVKAGVPVVIGPSVPLSIFLGRGAEVIQAEVSPHPFYDVENSEVAKCVLHKLGILTFALDSRPPCRFEVVRNVVLDVAHNPPAFYKLVSALHYHFPKRSFRFVLGFSKDKDIAGCLLILAPHARGIHFMMSNHPRLENPGKLPSYLPPSFVQQEVEDGEVAVIAGSFFIMKDARRVLGFQDRVDPADFQEKHPLV